jgi:putative heme-binding domain-containing protein
MSDLSASAREPASGTRAACGFALCLLLVVASSARGAEPLFERKNLVAWCIVPFDSKKRSPEERVAMLKKLGFTKYAYDWRAEHLPTFDREVTELQKANIELTAIWFPAGLNADAQALLAVVKKHKLKTQLWITMGDFAGVQQKDKVEAAAKTIRPIAEEADTLGCTVALYNHGGWFGEPENQIAIIEHLKLKNVGIVYNQHHGHDHHDRFPALLKKMMPHLLALNLNGMAKDGEKLGKKILPLGAGELDVELLKVVKSSGYKGPIGILGHTNDDAEERLKDNLDGLDWLLPQLDGKAPGPKPKYRTMASAPATSGWLAAGKNEYRSPPITVEVRAKINGKNGYNILVASDTKKSADHWEIFTEPNSGHLTVYVPGMKPDHVRSEVDVCDGKWHTLAMQFDKDRVRLFVDGKKVADTEVKFTKPGKSDDKPTGIAFARLVEGGLGMTGDLDKVRISKGIVEPSDKPLSLTDDTLGLWTFTEKGKPAEDSKGKNTAKPQARITTQAAPPPGPNLKVEDPNLKVTLISRSDDDAYMAVKLDGAGNLFVGGREKLFLFEPDGKGGFLPRRDLLEFPKDSIIIGLEYRGDDLYVLASHALYLVKDGRVKRTGLQPKRILWGLPLDYHVSFHCLAWGPEGDLYLTHGDPLLNYGDWSRPDHWGYWPLYAGPEGKKHHYTGQGAVLKVKPDGSDPKVIARGLRGPVGLCFDSKWNLFTNDNDHESRADQYAPMRLLHVTPHADFGWPRGWMASKSPDRADLLDSINTNLGRGVPCDLAFYDEPAIPALRGQLLQCRWDRFAVTRYALKPNGATFTAEEHVFAQGANNCRPTGVAVDTNGRIFVTSHYLAGNVQVPHCVSDLTMIAPAGLKWEPKDERNPPNGVLLDSLNSQSWEVRRRALHEFTRIKMLAAGPKFFVYFGDLGVTGPDVLRDGKESLIPSLRSRDAVVRLTACSVLANRTDFFHILEELNRDERDRVVRVIAAGIRLTVPLPDAPPPEGVTLSFPKFNGWFNPVLTFADEPKTVDLAKLGPIGSYTMAEKWKATKHTDEDEKLFALLLKALDDDDDMVKSQAAYYLGWLRDPRSEPKIAAVRLDLRTKGLKDRPAIPVKEAWIIGRFADPAAGLPLERGAIDLAQFVESGTGRFGWRRFAGDAGLVLPPGAGAVYGHLRIQSRERQPALLLGLGDGRLWHIARPITPESDGSLLLDLQPGSNDLLFRTTSDKPLSLALRPRGNATIVLPELSDQSLAERLKSGKGQAAIPPEFLKVDWSAEAKKGDAVNGRKLFGTLGCAKCHAITADQAGGGAPSLAEAGKRFTPAHLVESILMPDRLVAEEFRATSITTMDGVALTGLVVKEVNGEIEVLLPDTTRRTIKAADIESRKAVAASPMPSGVVKTVAELRDVLTYILSDNPQPP